LPGMKIFAWLLVTSVPVHSEPLTFPNVTEYTITPDVGQFACVNSVVVSPNSQWVALGGQHEARPQFYQLHDSGPAATPAYILNSTSDCQDAVMGLTYSPDGTWFAVACGTQQVSSPAVFLYSIDAEGRPTLHTSFKESALLTGAGSNAVAFSSDSTALVSASDNGNVYVYRYERSWRTLWQLEWVQTTVVATGGSVANSVTVAKNGRVWVGLWNNQAVAFDLSAAYPSITTTVGGPSSVEAVAVSPNLEWLAAGFAKTDSGNTTAYLYSLASGDPVLKSILTFAPVTSVGWCDALVFSPDSNMLAMGSWDETLRLFPVGLHGAGSPVALEKSHVKEAEIKATAFSPNGMWILSAACDGVVDVFSGFSPAGDSVSLI